MLLGAQNADASLPLPGSPVGDGGCVNLLGANKLREFIRIIVFTIPQGSGRLYTFKESWEESRRAWNVSFFLFRENIKPS